MTDYKPIPFDYQENLPPESRLYQEPPEETEAQRKNRIDCDRAYFYENPIPVDIHDQINTRGCNESWKKCFNTRCDYKLDCGYDKIFVEEAIKNHEPSEADQEEWAYYQWLDDLKSGRLMNKIRAERRNQNLNQGEK